MRSLDTTETLDLYIQTKAEISALEEKLESLKGEILHALMDEPSEKYDHHGFKFEIQRRATWSYSAKVDELSDVLKEAKAHERKEGIATKTKHAAVLVLKVPKTESAKPA